MRTIVFCNCNTFFVRERRYLSPLTPIRTMKNSPVHCYAWPPKKTWGPICKTWKSGQCKCLEESLNNGCATAMVRMLSLILYRQHSSDACNKRHVRCRGWQNPGLPCRRCLTVGPRSTCVVSEPRRGTDGQRLANITHRAGRAVAPYLISRPTRDSAITDLLRPHDRVQDQLPSTTTNCRTRALEPLYRTQKLRKLGVRTI